MTREQYVSSITTRRYPPPRVDRPSERSPKCLIMQIKRRVSLRILILILPVIVQEFESVTPTSLNGDTYQASSSLLKLSHHELSPMWHKPKQNPAKPPQAEHREVSNEVSPPKKRNHGAKSGQETNQAAKKNKLKSLMNQSKKISLSSILPSRSKQTSQGNTTGSQSINNNNNNKNNQNDTPPMIPGDEAFSLLSELPNVYSDPFLANGLPSHHMVPYPPDRLNNQNQANFLFNPSQSPSHHFMMSQASPGLLPSHHPSYSTSFNHNQQQASHNQQRFNHNHHYHHQLPSMNSFEQMFNSNRNMPSQAHSRLIARPENSAQEMFIADQSIENHHKIRLNRLSPHEISFTGAEMPPLILASTSPSAASNNNNQQENNYLNKTTANSVIRAAAQQKQQQVPTGNAASVVASALTSAAAAAILTERAKTLIGQLNQQTNNSNRTGIANIRNNREVTTALSENGSNETRQKANAANNNNGISSSSNNNNNNNNINNNNNNNNNNINTNLSNMIKNAAEVWATSNGAPLAASAQTIAGSSSNGVGGIDDSTPTIIVEHDGPTVTTLDFDGPRQQPAIDDDEDDVSSTFFSENDEAEQEEGSHEAKRSLKPRLYAHNHHLSNADTSQHYAPNSSRHSTHSSSMSPQALRHPNFDSHLDQRHQHHQQHYQHQPSIKGPSVPSASEFFEEPRGDQANDPRQNTGEHDQPANHNDIYRINRHEPTPPADQWQSRGHRPRDGPYPDSINAIKNQGSDNYNREPAPASPGMGDRKEKSTSDPIESLIKDLQELYKKRKDDTSSFTEEELGRAKGMIKSSTDDYEDILGFGRDDTGLHRDQLDQENEKTRLLRKKLLARLRSKHERKKSNGDSSEGKGSSFDNESIRIPLHALLLAALDRRMSSSESKSQSVAQDNLINDDRNKDIVLQGRRDFSEATANLGSLIDGNNLFEHLANLGSVQKMEDSLKPLNLEHISNESLTPAGMLLIENLSSFDAVNRKRMPTFDHQNGTESTRDVYDQSSAATTRMPSSTTSSPSPTPMPVTNISSTTSTTTAAPLQPSPAPSPLVDRRAQPSYKNHRADSRYTGKGRRAIEDEGDFDVDKQVNEYANDQYDRSLEPSWMKSSQNTRKKTDGASGGVEFDDEFDEIDRQTRRKMLNHRTKPRTRPRKQNTKADYVANEQRFFNNLKKDTSADINDVDQTIRSIENSIPDENQEAKTRRRAEQVDRDDDEDRAENCNRHGCNDSSRDEREDDDDYNDGETSGPRNRRYPHSTRGSKKKNSATWKASEVDAEIRRIEDDTRQRRADRGVEQDNRDDSSGSDEAEPNGDGGGSDEGEAESRHRRTTVPPDGIINMVLDPSGNGTSVYRLKQQQFN